ncbi:peptide chain release factor 1-like, mitochondrial [Coccinella septempunctata]|uniref:peptide chain release factor 1-like, mitochondrial n=1 Tax=Coccinella septempunctata TaxID=41139 RepID=UPI001D0976C4|nr:peptide chain release factor 1-like, mitochondrial [Coccinella septempunctata]
MRISLLNRILKSNKCNCLSSQFKKIDRVVSLNAPIIRRNESTVHNIDLNDFNEIKLKNVSLNKYLSKIEDRYKFLSYNSDSKCKKEIDELLPIINCINQRNEILKNIKSLKELEDDNDPALKDLIKSDLQEYVKALKNAEEELVSTLFTDSPEDQCKEIIFEINSGVGGQEAMLFAKELFEMYKNFAIYKGWKLEVAEYAETDLGGIRHGSLLISGEDVFKLMKYEAGVHRVQRIPSTEKGGRIHTSTVSILALPQPTDIQINIDQKDLRIETKRASGAGGQHVNTTDSAVRITHLPTGVSVECQVDRSQVKNRRIAMTKLRTLLYQRELDSQTAKIDSTKKSQVRTNFRNEKIRTYNFNQDRITDHRLQGNVHNLKGFLEGNEALEELLMKLDSYYKYEKLFQKVNEINS